MLLFAGVLAGVAAPAAVAANRADAAGPSDVQHAPDQSSAQAIAAKYEHAVVVDSASSPTLLIKALPDGSMQAESDIVPQRADVGGVWTSIDTSLQRSSDGWLEPAVAAAGVKFAPGGTDEIAQIQSESGDWFSENWPYGTLPTPTIDGAHATYSEVFPGVDLRLTATNAGMSEVLVVKSALAAANPELADVTLAVEGATVQPKAASRTLQALTAPSNQPVASATPLWWDSANHSSTADDPGADEPQAVPVESTSSSVSMDVHAIAATNPVYPIYVDPDWHSYLQYDWYTDVAFPDQSYYDPPSDSVGYGIENGVGYRSHAFFQFQTDYLAGKHVLSAHMDITQTYANSCDTTLVQLWEYGGSTTPGFTWNQEPNQWWQAIDAQGNVNGGPCAPAAKLVGFNATPASVAAASTGQSTIQLGLRVADESNPLTRKHYNWDASLTTNYNTPPATPTSPVMTSPPRACSTSVSSPVYVNNGSSQPLTFQVNSTDADPGPHTTTFYFYTATGSTVLSPSGHVSKDNGAASLTVAAGTLPEGAYRWTARATDGIDASPGYSPTCYFTVDNQPPALPTVSPSGPTTPKFVGQPMTATITVNPSDHIGVIAAYWRYGAAPDSAPAMYGSTNLNNVAQPVCGSSAQGVQFICPGSSTSVSVTVDPPDENAILVATSYDLAGNPSSGDDPSKLPGAHVKIFGGYTTVSAGADVTSVADANGVGQHRWDLTTATTSHPSANDLNTAHALPLTVGADATSAPSPAPGALTFAGNLVLDRYVIGSQHLAAIEDAPSPWSWEISLGQFKRPGGTTPSGMAMIYSCAMSSGNMTSRYANCENGTAVGAPLGYVWTSAPTGAGHTYQPVYRCAIVSSNDHFDSLSSTCEGQHVDSLLGYFQNPSPVTTSSAAVNTTSSFTVSARLTATTVPTTGTTVAISQGSGVDSDFTLGIFNSKWQFCVRTPGSATTTAPDCATSSTGAVAGVGQFVTGTFDSIANQVRISLGGTAQPSATVTHDVGAASTPGNLVIGSGRGNHAPMGQWLGSIALPSIYQGVASSLQLNHLSGNTDPNSF